MSERSEEEIEHIRLDILTTPKPEYPKVLDYFAEYARPKTPTSERILLQYVDIEWEPGRVVRAPVSNLKGHREACSRYKRYGAGFPVLMLDSCFCHDRGNVKKKSRGRFTKD